MVFLEEVRREGSHLEVRPINLLSKACRKSSWSCSVAHDEKAALDEAEVPGITEEEEEEPDAVAGPHSDVDGIANGENNFAQRWTMGEGPESRRTTTTTTSSSTRPLFIAFHSWPSPLSCFFLLYEKPNIERTRRLEAKISYNKIIEEELLICI